MQRTWEAKYLPTGSHVTPFTRPECPLSVAIGSEIDTLQARSSFTPVGHRCTVTTFKMFRYKKGKIFMNKYIVASVATKCLILHAFFKKYSYAVQGYILCQILLCSELSPGNLSAFQTMMVLSTLHEASHTSRGDQARSSTSKHTNKHRNIDNITHTCQMLAITT